MSGFRSPLWFLGISAGEALPDDLPYQGDTTIYDSAGATGSISGGTLLDAGTIYDSTSAMGSVTGGTVMPSETNYG